MPITESSEESKPESAWPGHDSSCWAAGATSASAGALSAAAVILSVRPSQPPTRCRPIRVSGSSEATITKNWSTSL